MGLRTCWRFYGALGILVIPLIIGSIVFDVEFYIVDLEPSFNLLLRCPWLHKHQVIPSIPHWMIKFRWDNDIVAVMAENFDEGSVEEDSSLQTICFDPKPTDTLYHVTRFELVNFIPVLEHASHLAIHGSPLRMIENFCHRWGYAKGTLLGQYGQGIAELVKVEERRDHESLEYDWQPHKDAHQRARN